MAGQRPALWAKDIFARCKLNSFFYIGHYDFLALFLKIKGKKQFEVVEKALKNRSAPARPKQKKHQKTKIINILYQKGARLSWSFFRPKTQPPLPPSPKTKIWKKRQKNNFFPWRTLFFPFYFFFLLLFSFFPTQCLIFARRFFFSLLHKLLFFLSPPTCPLPPSFFFFLWWNGPGGGVSTEKYLG